MKNILFIITLGLLLTSCEKEVKSKSCSFNDQPVDCATMNPQSNSSSNTGTFLSVEVKAFVEVSSEEMTIEILEGGKDIATDSSGNQCELEIIPAKVEFEITENNYALRFFSEGEYSEAYRRLAGEYEIFGLWSSRVETDGKTFVQGMKINEDGTATFTLSCEI